MTKIDEMMKKKDDLNDIDRRIKELQDKREEEMRKRQEEETRKQQSEKRESEERREPPKVRNDRIEDLDITKDEDQSTRQKDADILSKVVDKKRLRLRRREVKMYQNKEYEGTRNRVWVVVVLALAGLMFVFMSYYMIHEDWVLVIMVLLGSMMFLPVGMILGWAILDPYVRAKILRKVTHRNWGIINFVGKGQKIFTKIKNFDNALVWKKNEVWIITREHVYQITKDGDAVVKKDKIDPESIVTLIDTVPVLFVDLDSMQPLSLARDRREGINPLELGSTLKAWVDNQLAKAMFLKKTMDIYFIIIIICSVLAIGISYMNMNKIDTLTSQMKTVQGTLNTLVQQLSNATAPP